MADIIAGSVVWDLNVNDKKLKAGMASARDEVSKTSKEVGKHADSMSSNISGIGDAFKNAEQGSKMFATGLVAVGAAGVAALGFGIKLAANLETMTAGFVTLLGSTEKANAAIEMIKKDAASTPFELPGLIQANQLLTSVTKDATRSERFLLNIGKALTAMGKGQPELDRIIVNLQQIGAVGKASMLDIKQFAFAGIPIFDMLKEELNKTGGAITDNSKKIGESSAKLAELKDKLAIATKQQSEFTGKTKESTKMMKANQIQNYKDEINKLTGTVGSLTAANGKLTQSQVDIGDAIADGQVTFEMLENMFNKAGEGSGKFARAFIEQAGTFNQLFSNLKDNIGIAAAEIVQQTGVFDAVKKALAGLVQFIGDSTPKIVQTLQNLFKGISDNGPIIVGIIVGGLTPAFYALATSIWAAMAPLIPFIAAGAAIGLMVKLIVDQMGGWQAVMDKLQPTFEVIGNIFNNMILPALNSMWNQISRYIVPALQELWQMLSPVLIPVLKAVAVILGTVLVGAIIAFSLALSGIVTVINGIVSFIRYQVKEIYELFKWLFDVLIGHSIIPDLVNGIISWFRKIVGGVSGAMSGVVDAITNPFKDAWNNVKTYANRIKDALNEINPFTRHSPSLVDNVIRGVDIIKSQYKSLADISLPSISSISSEPLYNPSMMQSDTGKTTSTKGGGGVVVNIAQANIKSQQDIDRLGREFGFRYSLAK